MTRAVIIGDSHSDAIAAALRSADTKAKDIAVHRLENNKRAYIRNTISFGEAVDLVAGLSPDVPVFLCMLGTYHNIIGLLRPSPEYDFLLDATDGPVENAPKIQVPHRAMATLFEEHFAGAGSVRRLRKAAKSRMSVVSSPPPKQSNEFMVEKFMRQTRRAYRGQSIEKIGLGRPELRLKLWALEARLLERWAHANQMGFVPAPSKAFNDDGFLARKYYFDDATHANPSYGALVLDQIVELINCDCNGSAHNG